MTQTTEAEAIAVGSKAPDITLPTTAGGEVRLAAFEGEKSVLVAFFPLAFTGTCTAEMCAFSEDFDQFTGQNVVILPVSVDSIPTLQEFKRKYDMKVDLLSDFKRVASRAFGVLREDVYFARRSYFLIGKDGLIKWSYVEMRSGHRLENSEILAAIAEHAG